MVENKLNITPPRRNLNLDLIRCVAVFSVLSVHIFLNVPFYEERFVGRYMWVLTMIRTAFMMSVPLFALLTGYLCINKKLNKRYFKRIIPVLLTYLLACVFSLLVKMYWGEDISIWVAVLAILNTSGGAIGYSWYIEMYIGLFLMIPFLNIVYHGLETKRNKQLLILIMLILTTLPSMLNIHDLHSLENLLKPGHPQQFYRIFPAWWAGLWPLDYYFIGAYIREYDIRISKKLNFVLYVAAVILSGSFLFWRSYGSNGLFGTGDGYGDFDKLIHSVLAFLLLLHLDLTKVPTWIGTVLARISKLSLGIYLCSYVTDQYVYYEFLKFAETTRQKHMLAPFLMLLSFLLATMASQMIQWIMEIPRLIKRKT